MARNGSAWKWVAFAIVTVALAGSGGCYDDLANGTSDGSEPDLGLAESNDGAVETFASAGWTIQTVDSTAGTGAYNSLAYDSSGNPAISYYGPNGRLKFARWNGVVWNIQTVVSSGTLGNSLAFDASGKPTIAFIATEVFPAGSLKFAQWTGSKWTIKEVDSQGAGSYCSMVYDAAGQPAIAYRADGTPGKLKLARRSGSTWTKQLVDSNGVQAYLSLAFDPAGNPAIAYAHDADGNNSLDTVKFARKSGSSWMVEVVETGVVGFGVSATLAYDPATGHPAIAHGNSGNRRFVSWNGSAWVAEVITTDLGGGLSLAFDSGGAPCVAFYKWIGDVNQTNNEIYFSRKIGTMWVSELVETATSQPITISLKMSGTPAMAYRANNVLRYARRDAP